MKTRHLLLLIVVVIVMATAAGASARQGADRADADGEVRPYIVVMAADPAVAYEGDVAGYAATKPAEGQKIDSDSASVLQYESFLRGTHNVSLWSSGVGLEAKVHDYTMALNGYSALLTEKEAKAIEGQSDVVLVLEDQMRQPMTDSSPAFLGLTAEGGAWAEGLTGEGVIVGIIDSGIWPEHPSFADDGSFGPAPPLDDSVRSSCDFGNTAHNPDDAPFTCNNKLIGARQMLDTYRAIIGAEPDEYDSARDDDGHGTHTASTAAGNANVDASMYGIDRGTVSGIAPRAHVIAYKGLGNLGGFTSDLAAAIDQAVADGVDVINYSIGGGAAGPGADEIAFLFAADAGVHVATSAGNSGPGAASLGNPGTMPWMTTVGASTQSRFWEGRIRLGDGSRYEGASITPGVRWAPLVDAADATVDGDDLCVPGTLDESVVAGKIVLCRRGAIARAAKSLAVYQAGGVGTILYNNSDVDNLFSDTHWTPAVHIDNTPGLAIKAYIASASSPMARIKCCKADDWDDAPTMTIFSSRGPNPVAGDIIKPDVTAPGIQILAGNSPTPDPGDFSGELFQAIAGTSMSSPHVAGAFALLKQAHPDWSPAAAKSALMTTAYQDVLDNDRVSPADPFDMGAGHINLGPQQEFDDDYDDDDDRDDDRDDDDDDDGGLQGTAFDPGLVYDAGFFDYLGFLCDAFPEVFSDPVGTCEGLLPSIGIPTDASDLNLASIAIAELAGSQTVTRHVTAVFVDNGDDDDDDDDDGPVGVIENLANPDEAQVEVPEDDYVVTIAPAGSDTPVFGPVEVDLEDDMSHIFYAVGSLDDGSFTLLKQEIELEELDEELDEETDADTGTVTVVHGVPGLTVDVYVNGELALPGFEPGTVTDPLVVPVGDYDIVIVPAGGDPADPAISGSATVTANLNASIVAHLTESGEPTLSIFVNDVSPIEDDIARLVVRHTAAAPAVDVALFEDDYDNDDDDGNWITFRPRVDAPEGFDVTVTPDRLRLQSGDTASYQVTITNDGSAPIGEWAFGSLTWRGGDYKVRSPIAVRPTLLDAPAEIDGSGESGSASFDVTFGYTGSYVAAPHGLISATVTMDNVLQDPDQDFDPADGYSNPHQFTLTGAAWFRIAMPPEATEPDADLDIFVQDPTGAFVAQSTSGGTNELIDIPLPMDGTWTVWVHGWSTPGGDSDYNMWTWEIPLASGGSLSVDAAPASAVLGETGTVDVSWSGLTTGAVGDWYLGAVSHTGDVGLMGLTLVNVDNR